MNIAKILTGVAAVLGLVAVATPALADSKPNWNVTVAVAEDGTHTLGNPDAKVKISEFVSYTCPHCANFQKEAEAPLRLAYVQPGTVSVRIVHFIRDTVDLNVAMLVNCGDPAGFFARHHIFLQSQDQWLDKIQAMTDAQKARWNGEDFATSMRAITSDMGFYEVMEHRGYSRVEVDRCLADTAVARKLLAQKEEGLRLGIPGTPSFMINGAVSDDAYDWRTLDNAIKARL